MWRRLLEDWEVPYFNKMVSYSEDRNAYDWNAGRYDDSDIVFYRKGKFRDLKGGRFDPPKECYKVYQDYLRERARRKEEFDKWLELEMNRNRDRDEIDCVQTKTFKITLPRKTWRRIRELAKQYGKTVDQVVSIIVEATAKRFADCE